MKISNPNFNPREEGLKVEERVIKLLQTRFDTTPASDLENRRLRFDGEIILRGVSLRIDITISWKVLQHKWSKIREKNLIPAVNTGLPIFVNPRWDDKKVIREVMEQLIHNLPLRLKNELCRQFEVKGSGDAVIRPPLAGRIRVTKGNPGQPKFR